MERTFPRRIDALAEVFEFLDQFASQSKMNPPVRFAVSMAVEELFTNMVKYNHAGASDILLAISEKDKHVEVVLVDSDSEPFDITADQKVDTSAALDERTPGGLGLHLVQRMMDEIYYEHKNRRTQIRLVKNLN